MKIAVIGGTGWLGPYVVQELVASGHQVTVFNRGLSQGQLPAAVRRLQGDRHDVSLLTEAFRGCDAVVDPHPANAEDTRAAVEACRAARVSRLVAVVCAESYFAAIAEGLEDPELIPASELAPTRELGTDNPHDGRDEGGRVHARPLVEAELRAAGASAGLATTILRLPVLYGPHDPVALDYRFFIRRLLDGRGRLLLGGGACLLGHRLYIEDAAHGVALAVASSAPGSQLFNVAEECVYTLEQRFHAYGRVLGVETDVLRVPDLALPEHLSQFYTRGQHHVLDTTRARTLLGYVERHSPEERLRRTVEWVRQHPPAFDADWEAEYALEDDVAAQLAAPQEEESADDAEEETR
ncbi:MAG: NAD(P)H-binding protein [Deltaproteobacteria bacterium]|nr:NAD(P)H-binding protein [Deltaproteobacteria bacterium]